MQILYLTKFAVIFFKVTKDLFKIQVLVLFFSSGIKRSNLFAKTKTVQQEKNLALHVEKKSPGTA